MKTINDVINKLNQHDITVYTWEEDEIFGYELNTYTELGVNKIITLEFRGTNLDVQNPQDFIKLFNEKVNEIPEDEDFKVWKRNLQSIFCK